MSEPRRRCVGCGSSATQDRLTRVTRRRDGSLAVGRHEPGRGAWFCTGSEVCFDAASRKWGRALRSSVDPGATTALRATLFGAGSPETGE